MRKLGIACVAVFCCAAAIGCPAAPSANPIEGKWGITVDDLYMSWEFKSNKEFVFLVGSSYGSAYGTRGTYSTRESSVPKQLSLLITGAFYGESGWVDSAEAHESSVGIYEFVSDDQLRIEIGQTSGPPEDFGDLALLLTRID